MGNKQPIEDWIIVDRLADIILQNVKGCIVEIGMGSSTLLLSKYAKKFGINHWACDKKDTRCKWMCDNIEYEYFFPFNKSSFAFMKYYEQHIRETVALFFIDGNHNYEVVSEEADYFIAHLVPGGIGFFHDTYMADKWVERYKQRNRKILTTYMLRQDLEKREDINCFTFPYTAGEMGLTMVIKKEENPPYYRK